MRGLASAPRSIDMTCGRVIPRAMPKAARVKRGTECLPRYGVEDLGRMHRLLPHGKPRQRVRAAILRREYTSGEPHGMVWRIFVAGSPSAHTTRRLAWPDFGQSAANRFILVL